MYGRTYQGLSGNGIVSVHKTVVRSLIEKTGKWHGWICTDNVNGWHIRSGWHLGYEVTLCTVREMAEREFTYLSYNASAELGWRARYWQKSGAAARAPKTVRHYFDGLTDTRYVVKLSKIGRDADGKAHLWYWFGRVGDKSPIFTGSDFYLSPRDSRDWMRRHCAAELFVYFAAWAESPDDHADTEVQRAFLRSLDAEYLSIYSKE